MIKLGTNNIGKIYLGSNQIGRAYLGSNLVFQSGSSPTPPTPPTPTEGVPYIRGGADGSYIDTGITPDNTTKVIVWARNFNPGTAVVWLFGSRVAYEDSAFTVSAQSGTLSGVVRVGFGNASFDALDMFSSLSNYHKYEFDSSAFSVDDSVVTTITGSTFSNQYNIHIFGMNNGGTHTVPQLPIDICAVKIYKNGELVRDYTPVNTPSVGLYDSVSQTLFTNAGSGSFAYGSFNDDAYTPLDYIVCSGTQYFDSGVYGDNSLGFICKFMPTNTTAKWSTLLGQRISSPANSCDLSFGTDTSGQDNMRLYWRYGESTTSGQAFSGSTTNKMTNKEIIVTKSNLTATVYYNNSQIGSNSKSGVSSSFITTYPLIVGSVRLGESSYATGFEGRLYYVGFNGIKSFVPALVNNVVGMYDTYNDVFYPSMTDTPFIADTTI